MYSSLLLCECICVHFCICCCCVNVCVYISVYAIPVWMYVYNFLCMRRIRSYVLPMFLVIQEWVARTLYLLHQSLENLFLPFHGFSFRVPYNSFGELKIFQVQLIFKNVSYLLSSKKSFFLWEVVECSAFYHIFCETFTVYIAAPHQIIFWVLWEVKLRFFLSSVDILSFQDILSFL